jgi:death-on-curing protein
LRTNKRLWREPTWIDSESSVNFHDILIAHRGLPGFPHPGYLDSALAAPQQYWHYKNGGCDLYDLAAVYLYHIAKGHAFTDGNKRTAYATALIFLSLNGINILLPKNIIELAQATVDAAEQDLLDKTALASLMRRMPTKRSVAKKSTRRRKVRRVAGKPRTKRRGKRRL